MALPERSSNCSENATDRCGKGFARRQDFLDPALRRQKWEAAAPITVEDNVWLGGGVILLPGVTVGANTVVGAGAVVTKDLPPNVVAVGTPARVIRTL